MTDQTQPLIQQVQEAIHQKKALRIVGGNTKAFYGNKIEASALETLSHQGIVQYDASELVVQCRAGTSLQMLQAELAENRQMLAFEPPAFGDSATIGGTIACGFSGPRRPYSGSARDFVLGVKILNGKGEVLNLGGQVIKNVAGYDASRLMVGALGTLGVILEVSLKVSPLPEQEITLTRELEPSQAIAQLHEKQYRQLPLTAAAFAQGKLYIRLSDRAKTLEQATKRLPDWTILEDGAHFWNLWKEQSIGFFNRSDKPLWRISVPSLRPPLPIEGDCMIDWGGAIRWYFTTMSSDDLHHIAAQNQGHATCFRRNGAGHASFQPLSADLMEIHRNLKRAFDPDQLLNLGKMYEDL